MVILYLLLLFPLAWPFIAKRFWDKTLNWIEVGLNLIIVVAAVTAVYQFGKYSKVADVEIWNGQVVSKNQEWVSCEHSYDCNCREVCSGTGPDRSCNEVCDTCYDHLNDWDWRVNTDVGNFNIDRIDRRGSDEPPRWTKIKIGEPVAREHPFVNYIKAVPESLFHNDGATREQYVDLLPEYPRVADYYHVDRVISVGVSMPDVDLWNQDLALRLRRLGPEKEANVIVVLVDTPNQLYLHALEEHWLGGKKNDVVVILGVPEFPKIAWAHVMSWTDKELFKVQLRDALLGIKTASRERVIETIDEYVFSMFVRKQMADFEYLKDEIDPPIWAVILAFLIGTLGSVTLTYVFHRSDYFNRIVNRRRFRT